jgi:hypothetical protein
MQKMASEEFIYPMAVVKPLSTSYLMVQPVSAGICQVWLDVRIDRLGINIYSAGSWLAHSTNISSKDVGLHHERQAYIRDGSMHFAFVDLEVMRLSRLNEKVSD